MQVKIVNYIKKQIQLQRCIFCEADVDNILEHMRNKQHYKIPEQKVWDQPQLVHIIGIKYIGFVYNKILYLMCVLFVPDIIFLCLRMTHFYTILMQLVTVMKKVTLKILMKQRK